MVRKRFSKREIAFGIFCTSIVLFFLTFYIWHQVESVRLGYQTGKLEEEVLSLRKEVERLEAEKASLLALERVEKIAKEKLNMDTPKDKQLVYENFIPNP